MSPLSASTFWCRCSLSSLDLTAYGGRKETDLFIGAISESTFWPTIRTVGDMVFQYQTLLKETNYTSTDGLRKLDVKDLLTTAPPQPFHGGPPKAMPFWYWLPVIDGGLVPDQSYNLYQQGRFYRVPVLIGNAENEGSFFATNTTTLEETHIFLQGNYPRLTTEVLEDIDALYSNLPPMPAHAEWVPVAAATYPRPLLAPATLSPPPSPSLSTPPRSGITAATFATRI